MRTSNPPFLVENYLNGTVSIASKWHWETGQHGRVKVVDESVDCTEDFNRIVRDKDHQRARALRTSDAKSKDHSESKK